MSYKSTCVVSVIYLGNPETSKEQLYLTHAIEKHILHNLNIPKITGIELKIKFVNSACLEYYIKILIV